MPRMPSAIVIPLFGLAMLASAFPAMAQHLIAYAPGALNGVVGRPVTDANGIEIGLIGDVLVDQQQQPRVAILTAGGFMGVGIRHVAVAWDTLRFAPQGGETRIIESLTMDEVAAAPEYKGTDAPIQALAAPLPAAAK